MASNNNAHTQREIQEYLSSFNSDTKSKKLQEKNSNVWFNQLNETTKPETTKDRKKRDSKSVKSHKVSKPSVGRMYSFGYHAKTEKTLSYWDQYPLIICLALNGKLMTGVNLHYIPPKERKIFLDIIMKYSSTKTVSNGSYLKISPSSIMNIKWVKHMMKQYLFSHVVQNFREIAPKDWYNAVNLRTSQFTFKDSGRNVSAVNVYNRRNK